MSSLNMSRRRLLQVLAGLGMTGAAGGVGAAVYQRPTRVRVAGGPGEFFADRQVRAALDLAGLEVVQTAAGSRRIAEVDLHRYDALFPASAIVAQHVQQRLGDEHVSVPSFGSPMVVMSWRPVAELLERIQVAKRVGDFWLFDVRRYVDHAIWGTRWHNIAGSGPDQPVLLHTTDPRSSNSAAMLIAIAAPLRNSGKIPESDDDIQRVAAELRPCFPRTVLPETTKHLRDSYVTDGSTHVPIAFMYENDAVRILLRNAEDARERQMVLLYPTSNVLSQHHLVTTADRTAAVRLGRLLAEDPGLLEIARTTHGFRSTLGGGNAFAQEMAERGVVVAGEDVLGELAFGSVPDNALLSRLIEQVVP